MQIDLRVFSIPERRRVWRLFPGESYSFLADFKAQQVGFLDFPGVTIPEQQPKSGTYFLEEIKKSLALREQIYQLGRSAEIDISSLNISGYRSSDKRTRDENALVNFFFNASRGDLVVLPEPVHMSRVWIGQFDGHGAVSGRAPKRYGNFTIPARSIRWSRNVSENSILTTLSASLRQNHPFTLLERSLFFEVFAIAYGSYIFGERNAATFLNGAEFLDADASLLANVSKIAAAACRALDEHSSSDIATSHLTPQMLVNVLLGAPPIEYTSSQEADIHSPGFTRYTSGTIVPLVSSAILATLLALGGCSDKDDAKTKVDDIEYLNSAPNSDPTCNARVSTASKLALSMMGIDTTWAMCESAREAGRRGLKPSARQR